MKKNVKGIIGIAVIVLFAFAYAHIAKMNTVYDKNVDYSEYQSTGWGVERIVEQSFTSVEDTLDGIYLKCQTMGDVTDVEVHYMIKNVTDDKIAVEGVYPAAELESTKFNKITFDTISGCQGKEFLLTMWSENATDTNGVSYYFHSGTQNGTTLIINGEATEGTLIVKTITNRFDIETFCMCLILIAFIVVFLKFLYKLFK